MKAAILSVGTEILFGQIVNTNTVFLSRELNNLGIDVMYHYTVGDNSHRLNEMIHSIFNDCDLIITTGGLGPTQDDLTKETVAQAMGDELVYHPEIMEEIESYFKKLGRTVSENNRKQAYIPSKATIFYNAHGTAPGFALKSKGKCIICLPGPPREMEGLYRDYAKDYITAMSDSVIYYKLIRTFGIGESTLEMKLMDLIDEQTDPTIATYAKEGECYLRVASKRKTLEEAEEAVDIIIKKVKERVGSYIYSYDNEELSRVVAKMLMEKEISVSSAESCTGGLFAKRLTDIEGISSVFDRSLVTYSNRAKEEELGVSGKTLEKHGAVSPETAKEMAEGLHKVTGSKLCIAVTGIAGPDGGTEEKPVGLVYIGTYYDGKTTVCEKRFRNAGRKWVRNSAVLAMFNEIYKAVRS